jgi:hypothetical protein
MIDTIDINYGRTRKRALYELSSVPWMFAALATITVALDQVSRIRLTGFYADTPGA